MSETWITADLHIGHRKVLDFCPNRGFDSIEAHDEAVLASINAVAGPSDRLIILGDLSLCGAEYTRRWVSRIICPNRVLILGNHDRRKQGWYMRAGFNLVRKSTDAQEYNEWWQEIGELVTMSHYPFRPGILEIVKYAFTDWKSLRYLGRQIRPYGQVLLHGHVHNRWSQRGRAINVGWDIHRRPISQSEICRMLEDVYAER